MGYEISLHVIPKFGTFDEMKNTFHYLEWKNNPWNFENNHYPTYEEYWEAFIHADDTDDFLGEPSQELIDFYGKFESPILIDYWCSVGREYLNDFVTAHLRRTNNECYVVDDHFIPQATQWADMKFDEYCPKEVVPVKSIKVVDEDSETLTRIDGIIVEDDDGNAYTVYDDNNLLYTSNMEAYYCFSRFVNALTQIDTFYKAGYFVWFERSY